MMSTIKSIRGGFGLAAVATALLLAAAGPATANLMDNGDFEGGTVSDGGHPDPADWDVTDESFHEAKVIDSTNSDNGNSAFNADASNTQALRFQAPDEKANADSDSLHFVPRMRQTFSSTGVSGRYVFRFDFWHRAGQTGSEPDFAGSPWAVQMFSSQGVGQDPLGGAVPMAVEYRVDAPDGGDSDSDLDHFQVVSSGTDVGVNGLSAQTWYRVRAVLDTDTQTQSGWIKEAGSTSKLATWSDLAFKESANDLAILRLRDQPANDDLTGGVTDFDNITMIPEPASLALLVPAGLALLRRRRS